MADLQPNQAMKKGGAGDDPIANAAGKDMAGGESGGGAYANPHEGTEDEAGRFQGGQSHKAYSGTGDGDTDDTVGNVNAVTKED